MSLEKRVYPNYQVNKLQKIFASKGDLFLAGEAIISFFKRMVNCISFDTYDF